MMKILKNDTRYIIKKIIIGVGIALILAFLKTNNVFADTKPVICPTTPYNIGNMLFQLPILTDSSCNIQNGVLETSDFYLTFSNTSSRIESDSPRYDFLYNLFAFYNSEKDIYIVSYNFSSTLDNTLRNYKYFGSQFILNSDSIKMYNARQSVSLPFSSIFINNPPTIYPNISRYILISKNKTNLSSAVNTEVSTYFTINNVKYYTYLTPNNDHNCTGNNCYFYDYNNLLENSYYLGGIPNLSKYNNTTEEDYSKYYLYSCDDNNTCEINKTLNRVYTEVPSGFTTLTLKPDEAVYFVPKDYNNIQLESVQTGGSSEYPLYSNFIDFNYYFKGSIKDGYFPLNNIDDITLKNVLFSSPPMTSYVDSYFPLYQDEPNQSGYQYYSYIIYNNFANDTEISYNGTLFNAFIIHDLSTYSENICYIDRNNSNSCIDIDFGLHLQNWWIKGFLDDNDSFVGGKENSTTKITNFLDIIKFPFTWLKSLPNYTCSSLTLPLPFVNSSITLECLSNRFKSTLGDFYDIIYYIITGLYVYRITILNIDTFTDVLDPKDDKLEVVDL